MATFPESPWPSLELEHLLFLSTMAGPEGEAALNGVLSLLDPPWLKEQHPFHPGVLRRLCAHLDRQAENNRGLRRQLDESHKEHVRLEEQRRMQLAQHSKARIAASVLVLREHATPRDWANLLRKLWKIRIEPPSLETWQRRREPDGWGTLLAEEDLDPYRYLVVDHIYRHFYTQILIVDLENENSGTAFPFPVRVDVVDDGKARCEFDGIQQDHVRNDFRRSLAVAVKAARGVWLAKHGGYPSTLKDRIGSASVIIDATMGVHVSASAFRRAELVRHIELGQTSATLPIALATLSRFLGRAFDDAVLATGPLHPRDSQSRECEVAWHFPKDKNDDRKNHQEKTLRPELLVERKLNTARTLAVYERLVLPRDTPHEAIRPMQFTACRDEGAVTQTRSAIAIHPVVVPLLSNAVDVWLPVPWRQSQYIRAPELRQLHMPWQQAWRDQPLVSDGPLLEAFVKARCINIVGGGTSSSKAIIHALLRARARLADKQIPALRTLYFQCARSSEEEGHRHFWQTFLEALHVSSEDFESFDAAGTWNDKAQVVSGLLNNFYPSWSSPERVAPNVVVLAGFEIYRNRTWGQSKHLNDPWEIWTRIIPMLEAHGEQTHEDSLGRVRLVLETNAPVAEPPDADRLGILTLSASSLNIKENGPARSAELRGLYSSLPADLAEALTRLALFRWDFTFNSAIAVLFAHRSKHAHSLTETVGLPLGPEAGRMPDVRQIDSKRACEDLCRRGLLTEAQGRYHIPEYPRRELQELVSVESMEHRRPEGRHFWADLQLAAALSFAPALAPPEYPTILTSEGLLSINVIEAYYHCALARRIRPKSGGKADLEDQLQALIVRLLFPPGGRARFLMKMNLWLEARHDQEEWLGNLRATALHPRWLADIAETYVGQMEHDRTKGPTRDGWLSEVTRLFEESLAAFEDPELQLPAKEAEFERAFIEARYACLLLTECPENASSSRSSRPIGCRRSWRSDPRGGRL